MEVSGPNLFPLTPLGRHDGERAISGGSRSHYDTLYYMNHGSKETASLHLRKYVDEHYPVDKWHLGDSMGSKISSTYLRAVKVSYCCILRIVAGAPCAVVISTETFITEDDT
ncbi:hypothetical protein TNCV_2192741 [Trichonephila clavipes]|nr:hypothetical protein TNCV_2192741 [Trichonephila clavipes]